MSDDKYQAWRDSLNDADVVERARAELSRLCHGGRWQMTIPVDFERDSDVILGEAVNRLSRRGSPPGDAPAPDLPKSGSVPGAGAIARIAQNIEEAWLSALESGSTPHVALTFALEQALPWGAAMSAGPPPDAPTDAQLEAAARVLQESGAFVPWEREDEGIRAQCRRMAEKILRAALRASPPLPQRIP